MFSSTFDKPPAKEGNFSREDYEFLDAYEYEQQQVAESWGH